MQRGLAVVRDADQLDIRLRDEHVIERAPSVASVAAQDDADPPARRDARVVDSYHAVFLRFGRANMKPYFRGGNKT
jgi:hypothetical protein